MAWLVNPIRRLGLASQVAEAINSPNNNTNDQTILIYVSISAKTRIVRTSMHIEKKKWNLKITCEITQNIYKD